MFRCIWKSLAVWFQTVIHRWQHLLDIVLINTVWRKISRYFWIVTLLTTFRRHTLPDYYINMPFGRIYFQLLKSDFFCYQNHLVINRVTSQVSTQVYIFLLSVADTQILRMDNFHWCLCRCRISHLGSDCNFPAILSKAWCRRLSS